MIFLFNLWPLAGDGIKAGVGVVARRFGRKPMR